MHPPDRDAAPGVGRHRRPEPYRPRHRHPDLRTAPGRSRTLTSPRSVVLLAAMLLAAATSGSAASPAADPGTSAVALTAEASAAASLLQRRAGAADGTVSRTAPRARAEAVATLAQAPPPPPPAAQPRAVEVSVQPAPEPEPEPEPEPDPAPVGGLTQQQMDHAATIVAMGQRAGLPERAYVVAIATALQETYLRNLGNPAYPESLSLPNDGVGYDHDSIGLFQQRPSTGWGSVSQIMDPSYAATKFFEALARIPGWESLAVTVAAQQVQVSAYPDHYAKHEPLAREIVAALT